MGTPKLSNPNPPANVKRFRTNPVEIAIFSVITLIFFNSVYNLLYEQGGFKPTALAPMAATPISESGGRAPASVPQQAFISIDFKCDAKGDLDTSASKVRLSGSFCDAGERGPASVSGSEANKILNVTVTNNANKVSATVFTDVNSGKFSTDYIPLNQGKNPIHAEFSYRDGKTVTKDFNVVKN